MWLRGIAGIADISNLLPGLYDIIYGHPDTVDLQVCQ
jgi:hypothetical protein